MIKLLIVDDEPLVQIGIKSMLNWHFMALKYAVLYNGQAALSVNRN